LTGRVGLRFAADQVHFFFERHLREQLVDSGEVGRLGWHCIAAGGLLLSPRTESHHN
jgi:hypothetical protein